MDSNELNVYAILLHWPADYMVTLTDPIPTSPTKVNLLGYSLPLKWSGTPSKAGMNITLPALSPADMPCDWAWVLKLQHVN